MEGPHIRDVTSGFQSAADRDAPQDWKTALVALLSARLEMFSIEAKHASSAAAGKFALLAAGLFGMLSAWILTLAASIGAISAATGWQWYHIAFISAGVHLLIGGALLAMLMVKSGKHASFPVTRAEFRKDREWLNRLQKRNDT